MRDILCGINHKIRIGIVCSVIWLIVAMAIAIGNASKTYYKGGFERERTVVKMGSFTINFLFIGVLPLVVSWGVVWIKSAKPNE